MEVFLIGEAVVRSLRNGRAIRRASMDIAETRRREENREPPRRKIAVRIENGRNAAYLNRMMGNARIHTARLTANVEMAKFI